MIRNIKCFSLTLLALGLSAPVLAASSPFSVTVPNQQGGFSVGADVLWLRPNSPNTNFGIITLTPTPELTNISVQSVDPSNHWAFDLMVSYRIPCTGNDISALWTHLGNASNSHEFFKTISAATPFTVDTTGTSTFKYDSIDLDLGQRINLGDYFNFRLFVGVRGVNTEEDFNRPVSENTPSTGFTATAILDQSSKLRGIGPQIGIESRYCVGYGFGIDAGTTLSALVGSTDSSASFTAFSVPATVTLANNISADRKYHVVPALDLNLGADYIFNFNNCSRSSLAIQGGYKIIHYWDAHQLLSSNSTTSFDPTHVGFNTISTINFDGPYLGLKVNV